MKKTNSLHRKRKLLITSFVMLALIFISAVISWQISKEEEKSCWDNLRQSVGMTKSEITAHVTGDRELLYSVADIIAAQDSAESPEVTKIIDSFKPNTLLDHLALLLPEDRLMLPNEPIRDVSGLLSFEEEAAEGCHISGKSKGIKVDGKPILRSFVPVVKDGETVAMLYGVTYLETLPDKISNTAYDGNAAIYIVDGENGDFLLDTWHNSLGNMMDLGDRKVARGYSQDKLHQDVFDVKAGHCIFMSESMGDYLYFYYEPININKWLIAYSLPKKIAFGRLYKINILLIVFIVSEIILLAGYFIYILKTTKRELEEKQKLAERDLLTGLLNRNSYESNLHNYPKSCKFALTCVYVDVNGLHDLNNTQGHTAGDNMLKAVAYTIRSHFGDKDTYRIGGDEFVAFARDEHIDSVKSKIDTINAELTELKYHVSVGMCESGMPIDIDELIKQAEKYMYEEKTRYYDHMGIERRTHVK